MLYCRQGVTSGLTRTRWNTLHLHPLPFAGGPCSPSYFPVTGLTGEITTQGKNSLLINLTSVSSFNLFKAHGASAQVRTQSQEAVYTQGPVSSPSTTWATWALRQPCQLWEQQWRWQDTLHLSYLVKHLPVPDQIRLCQHLWVTHTPLWLTSPAIFDNTAWLRAASSVSAQPSPCRAEDSLFGATMGLR